MKIEFTVLESPKGKQRPRICRINSSNVTYTPKQTTEYENLVRASYTEVSKMFFDKSIPLEISIITIFLFHVASCRSQAAHKTYLKKKAKHPT